MLCLSGLPGWLGSWKRNLSRISKCTETTFVDEEKLFGLLPGDGRALEAAAARLLPLHTRFAVPKSACLKENFLVLHFFFFNFINGHYGLVKLEW